jgi:hypothetical protein
VLGDRALDDAALRDAAPDPRSARPARQALEQLRQHRVARCGADRPVKREVVLDELLDRLAGRRLLQQPAELGQLLLRDRQRGERRRRRLQDPPHLQQVEHAAVLVQVDHERDRVEQHVRRERRDVGAVALAHVEDPHQRQRAHGLAQRVAREPEPLGEVSLTRQPIAGRQLARDDHLPDLLDGLVGDAHWLQTSDVSL